MVESFTEAFNKVNALLIEAGLIETGTGGPVKGFDVPAQFRAMAAKGFLSTKDKLMKYRKKGNRRSIDTWRRKYRDQRRERMKTASSLIKDLQDRFAADRQKRRIGKSSEIPSPR